MPGNAVASNRVARASRSRRLASRGTPLVLAASLASCTASPAADPSPTAGHSTPPAAATSRSGSAATPAPVTLASCGAAVDVHALRSLHRFTVSPDDIAVDPQGDAWVTAREAGLLVHLAPDGSVLGSIGVAGGPEGVAVAPSGVAVVEQDVNAIVAVSPPPAHSLARFPNPTANAGVDGIAVDEGQLLVPDSPTGELFSVPLTGSRTPRRLTTGLGRPVAAASDSAGDVFVASESSPGLVRLRPDGTWQRLGRFTDLDEVVAFDGLLYVADLAHRDVLAVDPVSGAAVPVAVNLPAPQGLAVSAAGLLEIVDSTMQVLYALPTCGMPS